MARSSTNLSELQDRALVVSKLRSLGPSLHLTDSQLQDKLTIHFQKRKCSHGGDVLDVIYPLNSSKDDAIVIFEEVADRESAVNHEQVFHGQPIAVSRLPPVFTSIQAEIHPLYFKILPLRMADEFPTRFHKVGNVLVDKTNFGRISCSKPVDLECVEREVIQLVMSRGGKFPHYVSMLADDVRSDAAGSSNFEAEATHQPQRSPGLLNVESRKSQNHYEEEMEQRMLSEEPEELISAHTSSNDGHDVSERKQHRENQTLGSAGSYDEDGSHPGQDTHVILDKYTHKYLKSFQGKDLQGIWKKYNVHLKIYPGKLEGHLEGVVVPSSAKTKSENVVKAKDEFIILYQKAHVDITRKTLDCTAVQRHNIEVASKKTLHDFKADTLIEEIDGSPHLRLILRHGDVEEVARLFRSFAGIKSGKTLRSAGTSGQDVKKSHEEVSTSKDTQWSNNTQGTQWGNNSQAPTEKPQPQQMPSHTLSSQASQYPNKGNEVPFVTNEGMQIVIKLGDITKQLVQAVVSPSDSYLSSSHGGVASAIFSAAGPEMKECCSKIMRDRHHHQLKVAECIVTPGFKLTCDVVIHAVGPTCGFPIQKFGQELYGTFLSCLCKTQENKLQSLAIPLIGSGHIGAPKKLCADALVEALLDFSSKSRNPQILQVVYLVNIDRDSMNAAVNAMNAQFKERAISSSQATARFDSSQSIPTDIRNPRDMQGQILQPPLTDQYVSASNTVPQHDIDQLGSSTKTGIPDDILGTDVADTSPSTSSSSQANKGAGTTKTGIPDDILGTDVADTSPSTSSSSQADKGAGTTDEKTNACPICLADDIVNEKVLDKCKHRFCKECIDKALETTYRCPVCQTVCKQPRGNQPDGTMVDSHSYPSLPGYPRDGTITIRYNMPSGIQTTDHPHLGRRFSGVTRTAFLPDNQEGREVLRLIRKAFDARLVFTVGRSVTSSIDDTVTWNDIHHKTSQTGGASHYGYPDPGYLKRVKEDLAAKGISE